MANINLTFDFPTQLSNVVDPAAAQDAATKNYVDSKVTTAGLSTWFSGSGVPTLVTGAGVDSFYWDVATLKAYLCTAVTTGTTPTQTWVAQPHLDGYVLEWVESTLASQIGTGTTVAFTATTGLQINAINGTTLSCQGIGATEAERGAQVAVFKAIVVGQGWVEGAGSFYTPGPTSLPFYISNIQNPAEGQYAQVTQMLFPTEFSGASFDMTIASSPYYSGTVIYPTTILYSNSLAVNFVFVDPPATAIKKLAVGSLVAGSNITLTPNATGTSVTVAAAGAAANLSTWFKGSGAPTAVTGAVVDSFYWDTVTKNAYICTAITGTPPSQTWLAQPNLDEYVIAHASAIPVPGLFNLGQALLASQSGPLVKVVSAVADATRTVTVNTGGPGFGAVTFDSSVNPPVGASQFVGVSDPTNETWGGIGRINQQLNGIDIIAWIIPPPANIVSPTVMTANCNVWFLINATASFPVGGTLVDAQDNTSSAIIFPTSEATLTYIDDTFGQQAVRVAIPRVKTLNNLANAVTLNSSDSSVSVTAVPDTFGGVIDLRVAPSAGAGTVIAVNNTVTNYNNFSYLLNGSTTTPQNGAFAAQIGAGSGTSSNPLALAPLNSSTGGWSFKLGATKASTFTAELGGQVQTIRVKAAGIWDSNIQRLATPIFIQRGYITNDALTHEFPGFQNTQHGFEFLSALTPEVFSQRFSHNQGNPVTSFSNFIFNNFDQSYQITLNSSSNFPTTTAAFPFCTIPLFVTFNGLTTYLGSEWQVVSGLGSNNIQIKLTASNAITSPTGFDIEFYHDTVAASTAGFSTATVGTNIGGVPFTADDQMAIIWDYGLPSFATPTSISGFFEITFNPNSWYRSSTELNPTGFTLPSDPNQDFLFSWLGYMPSGMVTAANGVRLFHSLNTATAQDRFNSIGTWNNRLTLSYGGQVLPYASLQYYPGYYNNAPYVSGLIKVKSNDGFPADPLNFKAGDFLSFGVPGEFPQVQIISTSIDSVDPTMLDIAVTPNQPNYSVGLSALIRPAASLLFDYPFVGTQDGLGLNTSSFFQLDSGDSGAGDRLTFNPVTAWTTFVTFPYVSTTTVTGGQVITYTVPPVFQGARFGGLVLGTNVYRFVPSPYAYTTDAFFNVFNGTAYSAPLNIVRSI